MESVLIIVIGALITVIGAVGIAVLRYLVKLVSTLSDKQDARFDKLEEKYDARFDKLEEKYDARFDKQDARFDRLEVILTDHGERLIRIEVILENHEKRFDRLEADMAQQATRIDGIYKFFGFQGERIARLEEKNGIAPPTPPAELTEPVNPVPSATLSQT